MIPARLESSRFPRKVLVRETGKFLIEHVYERVVDVPGVDRTIIATDSPEVVEAARSFGAEAWLTATDHVSGTDRVAEVARALSEEIVINVQGDEPLVSAADIARLIDALAVDTDGHGVPDMATLARERSDREGFRNPNIVKVVRGRRGDALYFSRSSLPHDRDAESSAEDLSDAGQANEGHVKARVSGGAARVSPWLQHIGVYGFASDFLEAFTKLAPGELEQREKLEQLRALENGFSIRVLLTEHDYTGVDTEEDYREFVERTRGATR